MRLRDKYWPAKYRAKYLRRLLLELFKCHTAFHKKIEPELNMGFLLGCRAGIRIDADHSKDVADRYLDEWLRLR